MVPIGCVGSVAAFGWKTSLDHHQDYAVCLYLIEPGMTWQPIFAPVDLAFVLTTDTGTIILEKQTDPDGDPQSFDILDAGGVLVTSLSDNGTCQLDCQQAGTYTFSEAVPDC